MRHWTTYVVTAILDDGSTVEYELGADRPSVAFATVAGYRRVDRVVAIGLAC